MPNFESSSVLNGCEKRCNKLRTTYMKRLENNCCGYKKPDVEIIAVMAEFGFGRSSKNEYVDKDDEVDFY